MFHECKTEKDMTVKNKILLGAMLSSFAAQAGSWQFSALGEAVAVTNGEAVVSWGGRGSVAITPMHNASNGWEYPAAANGVADKDYEWKKKN